MGLFGTAHRWGRRQKGPILKICDTYSTVMKLCTGIPYLNSVYPTPFLVEGEGGGGGVEPPTKFGNSGISMAKAISVAKGKKLKVRWFLGLISTSREITWEKLVGRAFFALSTMWGFCEDGTYCNMLLL